jgi:hypothetical protein
MEVAYRTRAETSRLETEAGGSSVRSQPELHSEFQASLDYITQPCLKKRKRRKEDLG